MFARTPQRLLIAPQDIRTGDPTIAADIYAGYYAFGGKIVDARAISPFEIAPPSESWAKALNGFGWLRHLRAANTNLARGNARALVEDFIAVQKRGGGETAWEPRTVARRTLSFLSHSPLLLGGDDAEFYRNFMRVLARGAHLLQRRISEGLEGEPRLLGAVALAAYGLCVQGGGPTLKRATRLLIDQIDLQILRDGGHIGRNPQTLVDLLFDFLPLRQTYAARGLAPPDALLNAIDRMMPMLRTFRHGDGALALFNGMGVTAPERIATLLTYDDARGQPLANARYSGYQRLEGAGALALVDCCAPPPPVFSGEAHAGCLSFEFSFEGERIVVNCGNPGGHREAARQIARATAAIRP